MEHSSGSLVRRLKLQQLAIFEKVAETGSMLAASRELHMTQPAVSKSIRELEQHFNETLFTRGKRGVQLTDFGELLRRHAQSLLAGLRFLADDANSWSAGISGQVVVGTLLTASAKLLPRAVLRLREIAPNIIVKIRVGSNDALFPELARGQFDVVIGFLPEESANPSFVHVPLYDEMLCAVVSRHHPLALDAQVDIHQLQDMAWIVPTVESVARRSAHSFFEAAGMAMPGKLVESVSFLTNLGLLLESTMIALMPYAVAEQFVRAGLLSILRLGVASPFGKVGYTLMADRPPTAATARLLAALEQVAGIDALGSL
jgi:DNA-binding transcriptional LysR family regulator